MIELVQQQANRLEKTAGADLAPSAASWLRAILGFVGSTALTVLIPVAIATTY
jgi:hypothetical protein